MEKTVHNLLTKNTSAPVQLDSSNGTTMFTGPIIVNDHAQSGMFYCAVNSFWSSSDPGSVTTGFVPKLYFSPAGRGWFLHTTLAAVTTAGSYTQEIADLGSEIRLGYVVGCSSIGRVRCYLELNEE